MKEATKRSILRSIHITFGLPIIGYIYGPQDEVQQYVDVHRCFLLPVLLFTGFWMWKGQAVRRLFSKRSASQDAAI
jgi:hypothetical protein